MRKYLLICSVLALISLSSCQKGDNMIDYVPFQSEENGNWGFINTDGEVLLEDEFNSKPTVVSNDRFFVKNKAGYWELYTADNNSRQVGKEYVQAGAFIEDVAPVVEKDKPIEFIDKDGNVKFTLGSVDGLAITSCRNFSEGLAIFKCGDYYGAIDASGNVVIKPDYLTLMDVSDGKLLGVHRKYEKVEHDSQRKISVLDTSGKVLSELSAGKYDDIQHGFHDGVLAVAKKDSDGDEYWGLIDEKGEWVLHPSHKIRLIKDIKDDKFIFSDGERYGLMNFKGEMLIRAKYLDMCFTGSDQLFVRDNHTEGHWKLITEDEDVVSPDEYDNVCPTAGDKYFVQDGQNSWIIIDKKGKEVQKKADIYNFDLYLGDTEFESQYVDVTSFVNQLRLKADGLLGLNLSMNAGDVVKSFSFLHERYGDGDFSDNPDSYNYVSQINVDLNFNKVKFQITAMFDDIVANQTVYSGFEDVKPNQISVTFYNDGLLGGHLNLLNRVLMARLKTLGKVVKSNDNSLIVASGGAYYFVGSDGDKVYLNYGNFDVNAINLNMFTGSDDAVTTTSDSYADDTEYADSVYLDSAIAY